MSVNAAPQAAIGLQLSLSGLPVGPGGTRVSSGSEKEQEFWAQASEWVRAGQLCPRLAPQAQNLPVVPA